MAEYTHGKILSVSLTDEMRQSYIDYSMSVIVSRALPDVRDGLKPVHRRILYAMRDMGLLPDRQHRKSVRVVGEVLGKYHPHSDAPVYEAMVRLAQEFSTRNLLVDGHGNFGSVDGDPPAAMRYTEARLSALALEMMRDLDKDTVDFRPNFDESEKEPVVLPARYPNLLVNGSSGIAVGMATNIPPHNLGEVIDAVTALLDQPDLPDQDLFGIIRSPDFPTGGLILGREGIRQAYTTGRGVITMRAVARIEPIKGGRNRIMVTEIPYQVNKARLIERIAELVRERKIEGITDLRDESDRTGLRIVLELSRHANPQVVLNLLYKFTPMQQSFGIILLSLVDGRPRVLTLRQMLDFYIVHQKEVIIRRTRHELAQAEARAHILEGLRIALDNIDAIIALIRASRTVDIARQGLMKNFDLSEKQAQAILDMRLQRLTGLERDKIEKEYQELLKQISYLKAVLGSEQMVKNIIKTEIGTIKDRFADDRRTRVVSDGGALDVEDLIAEEDMVVTLSHTGYIKRMPLNTYRRQRRGGRGIIGMETRSEDFVEQMFITTTHHYILFFTNRGWCYRVKVHEVPEGTRKARGTAAINLINLQPGELVTTVIPVREFSDDQFLFMATRQGLAKKSRLSAFSSHRRDGLIAVNLDEGDELVGVRMTNGRSEILLTTAGGMSIRFGEDQVRSMGRMTRGVKGIALEAGDEVVSLETVDDQAELLVASDLGYGKRTPVHEYRSQTRGGKGLKSLMLSERSGRLIGARMVKDGNELMFVSKNGIIIRMEVDDVPRYGRNTQGVRLMRLEKGDHMVAVAQVVARDDEEDQAKAGENGEIGVEDGDPEV